MPVGNASAARQVWTVCVWCRESCRFMCRVMVERAAVMEGARAVDN